MVFSTKSQCQEHVNKTHPGDFPQDQVSSMIDLGSKRIDVDNEVLCPFCKEPLHSVKEYQLHVGRHQEQLALFALPPIANGKDEAHSEDEDDEDSGEHSNDLSEIETDDDGFVASVGPRESINKDQATVSKGVLPPEGKEEWEVPSGAGWTKISRQVVTSEALEIGMESFEIRGDFLIVGRVLSHGEIKLYTSLTRVLRETSSLGGNDATSNIPHGGGTGTGKEIKLSNIELSQEEGAVGFSSERSKISGQDDTKDKTTIQASSTSDQDDAMKTLLALSAIGSWALSRKASAEAKLREFEKEREALHAEGWKIFAERARICRQKANIDTELRNIQKARRELEKEAREIEKDKREIEERRRKLHGAGVQTTEEMSKMKGSEESIKTAESWPKKDRLN
ncbi:hypothetical protein FIE12Z_12356 [Fusarium flagelliforme]|uniref:DUF8035 domain-containing protein n=2 Tax=Fusarium flagelliforme TaxID=2675880 RepID=A0A395M684_9HYPO|nr:hypothetical protein FIE12Z_12356 [Fusarium flagelliforme]